MTGPAAGGREVAGQDDEPAVRFFALRTVLRRTAVGVAVFAVLTSTLLLVACLVDDLRIDSDMGSATATVTEVGILRTAVEFDTETGGHVRPRTGVFYPTGLEKGQRVRVEYRRANPELVRVSGRSWLTAVWPAVSVSVFALPLCVAVYVSASPRVHRRSPLRRRRVARGSR